MIESYIVARTEEASRVIVGSNLHLLHHVEHCQLCIVLHNFLQRISSISHLLLLHIMMYNCIDSQSMEGLDF